MAKQSKKVEVVVEEVKASKRGNNRDPKALQKLSLKMAFARTERISAMSKPQKA